MPRVNSDILAWARETAGLSLQDAVEKLGIADARGIAAVDRLLALESGDESPSRPLLLKMAKQYRRPLLTFYMSEPPKKGDRGQDFRTLPEEKAGSDALLDALIRDVRARQSMVRDVLKDEDEAEPLPFIGSMTMEDGVPAVLASIWQTISVDAAQFRAASSVEQAFGLLRAGAEAAGIFVLLIGNLGSHHTALEVEAFRGFALADPIAPFVVINDQDAKPAWAFTLLHELAHLWLGATGVSGASAELAIERFCNDVAGEFLLPKEMLLELGINRQTRFDEARRLINEFADENNLSRSMVAYRLFQAGLIKHADWQGLRTLFRQQWLQQRADSRDRTRDRESGPNYYIVRRHRVGSALISLVRRMMADGALSPAKAGKVLGVKPMNVQALINTPGPNGFGRAA